MWYFGVKILRKYVIDNHTVYQIESDWKEVQTSYPLDSQPKDVNLKLCFVGAYSYSFLVDGLKIGKDKQVDCYFAGTPFVYPIVHSGICS